MKKIILIAILIVYSFTVSAQNKLENSSGVIFGVKAGVNFATITGDDTEDVDTRTSFHAGVVVEMEIFDKFSFQPEILYSSQGAKGSSDGMDMEIKYDYLNIPLLVKYYLAEGFSIEGGPQVGILLSADGEASGISVDIKDITKDIDFSLDLGLGYILENGLNFAARYNFGISNINDNNGTIMGAEFDFGDVKNYNGVFQLSVGYMF